MSVTVRALRAESSGALGHRLLAATVAALAVALMLAALVPAPAAAAGPCTPPIVNQVACENTLPGDPPADWEVDGIGDPTIQGFATSMSVSAGQTISFKVKTPSTSYHVDILRLGWYGGDGARIVASNIHPSATLPQSQPACLTQSSTGLIDCGNWAVSASWTVPSTAVSGVYIAHLVRNDSQAQGGSSQVPFVVRNDASHADVLVPTDDATWEAYNNYGGNSLYKCTVACPPGNPGAYKGAYAVSYNRPWDGSSINGGASYLWYAEYQMIQFLERNGYDVSYTDDINLDSQPSLLLNHKAILFSGHDEYWSGAERTNVTAARDAGVNLAMFTGNEIFWKTRWGPSADGSNTSYRTLISYKETHFDAPVDPSDPPTWTGAWADPRFSPPADGGKPSNSLSGQQFEVNSGTSDITVPSQYSKLRLWKNTAVANLGAGQSVTLGAGDGTLGYEWDVNADNGFRPPGLFDLSSTTVSGTESFLDYGTNTGDGTTATPGSVQTHHLTLYRAGSGALVFGAGTVQWSWGLDDFNAWGLSITQPSGNPPDPNMQQFTVNLLAMMGAQPATLISGLVAGTASTVTTPPTSTISSPAAGSTAADGSAVTIAGAATAAAGAVVAGVEVSTDGGTTWHPATLTTGANSTVNWSYSWIAHGYPSTMIQTRAADDSGNRETPSNARTVNITCPCSLWGTNVNPATVPFGSVDSADPDSITVGVRFKGSVDSQVTGLRFYKASTNTGTHIGSLWSSTGTLLAQATFTNETASGWQTVAFSNPVLLQAGQTYVAGYFAPNGHFSRTQGWFYPTPAPTPLGGATTVSGPWSAVINTGSNVNGVFAYAGTTTFPTNNFAASNFWVDPVLAPLTPPGQVTGVTATAGTNSASLTWSAPTTGGPATTYTITPYIGSTAQTTTTVTGSPAPTSATVTGLTANTAYTFTVQASNTSGPGPVSAASNSVTPGQLSAPAAPTGVSANPAGSQALMSWTAPANGGSPITSYTITPFIGSTAQTPVQVNSGSATAATVSGLTNGVSYTFTVAATNSIGTGAASSATNAVVPRNTIFDFATPALVDSGDSTPNNLGVEFTSSQAGTITGIRFYKAAANTGTHVGSLWSSSGTLLAQGTFTNETSSGWQTLVFATPVNITAGTTYIASYLAPSGHFSMTRPGFDTAVTNGPLTGLANGSTTFGNGVYANGSTTIFPSNSYQATNYGVDVLFNPGGGGGGGNPTAPGTPTGVAANPAGSQALVSWTAPSNGGSPITGYTITPFIGSTAQTPIQVNSGSATSAVVTGLTDGTAYTFTVAATNSVGTSAASSATNAVIPRNTIFDFATPALVDSGDSTPNNLGVEFSSSQAGTITGIRFYKAAANTGTHVGSLWDTSGNLLAQGTFTNETSSGWQTLVFATPVNITAGTTYIASYLAPSGHFSMTRPGFDTAVTNGPLTGLANGSTTFGNGVYANGSSTIFPSNSYQATNYGVDVLFNPGGGGGGNPTAPGTPTGVAANPAGSQALVSWTAPANGGSPITSYTLTPFIGSTAQTPIQVNSGSATSAVVTGLTNGTAYAFTVAATNAVGTGTASSASSAITPRNTIFDFTTPGTVDSGDSTPNNLGVEFTANQNGTITGIRFYKAAANTGTHVGSLWSSSGTLLAQGTFTNETSSGWQTLVFATPVNITAGTTYIASYLAPSGHFSMTRPGFDTAVTNGPLTGLANGSTTFGNGVYANGSTTIFPSNSYQATNYGVDVLFNPGGGGGGGGNPTAPGTPTGVAANPAGSQALVSWTAPANGGSPITGYKITPFIGSTAQTPVTVNSGSATAATVSGLTNGTSYTFTVAATNAIGTSAASSATNAVIPRNTIFDFTTPGNVDPGDSTPNNLGVEFTANQNGTITGIRFYKAAANTGTHVGSLWDTSGNLLAQGTFTNETSSGWQTLVFATPVNITAGITYIASYLAPSGHFSMTRPGFDTAVTNGPLTALANGSTTFGNGVYANGSTTIFPSNSYQATNYGVDVLFNPGGGGGGGGTRPRPAPRPLSRRPPRAPRRSCPGPHRRATAAARSPATRSPRTSAPPRRPRSRSTAARRPRRPLPG